MYGPEEKSYRRENWGKLMRHFQEAHVIPDEPAIRRSSVPGSAKVELHGRSAMVGCTVAEGARVVLRDSVLFDCALGGNCTLNGSAASRCFFDNGVDLDGAVAWMVSARSKSFLRAGQGSIVVRAELYSNTSVGAGGYIACAALHGDAMLADDAVIATFGNWPDVGCLRPMPELSEPVPSVRTGVILAVDEQLRLGAGARLFTRWGQSLTARRVLLGPGASLYVAFTSSCRVLSLAAGGYAMLVDESTNAANTQVDLSGCSDLIVGRDAGLVAPLPRWGRLPRARPCATIRVRDNNVAVL